LEPRLFVEGPLDARSTRELDRARAHYLGNVLRLRPGASIRVFNAAAGEWSAVVTAITRHEARIEIEEQVRAAEAYAGPCLAFAPIRRNRMDWLVEKATELGVGALLPVITERCVVRLEKIDRLRAIAVEASEQCGRLSVPELLPARAFDAWLSGRAPAIPLYVADEEGGEPLLQVLQPVARATFLIGPEGGFSPGERRSLRSAPGAVGVTLGPRILRAETAGLAVLSAWVLSTSATEPAAE
jgi:16S rRNA (uracil1498-N3)-methyltransferase